MRELEKLVEKDFRPRRDVGQPAANVRPRRAHPIVLVVDDAGESVKQLSIYLSRTGYQVVTAVSAEDCLAKLRRHHIDAIVLDPKMQGASGAHVCRVLQEDPKYADRRDIPLIVYTTYPDEFPADVRADWNAADCVVKSTDLLPLITALVRHTTSHVRS
jgi:CheY-like chemotaxis protein